MTILTPESCRAARAILKWSIRDLATNAGIAKSTINLLENGNPIRPSTSEKIIAAFAEHNVEITNGDGTGARLILNNSAQ